jgi:PAS domain S-box-containing protein
VRDDDGDLGTLRTELERLRQTVGELEQAGTDREHANQKLGRDRDKLRSVLDAMADPIYLVNGACEFEYCNPALKAEFGQCVGLKCTDYFEEWTRVCPWCVDRSIDRDTVRWEWHSTKTGRTYDLLDTPVINPEGSISRLGILRDITDMKQATVALAESEEKYRSLVENVDLGITLVDLDHNIITANAAVLRIYGRELSEVVGKKCFCEYQGRSEICPHCPGERTIETGRVEEVEAEGSREDGTRYVVRIRASPIFAPDRSVKGFVEVVEDITERRRAKEEMASLAKFPAENTSPVLRIAGNGTVVYANEASSDMLSEWGVGCSEEAPEAWRIAVAEALATGERGTVEAACGDRVCLFSIVPIRDAHYANLYGADISHQKRAEGELIEAKHDLERRVAERTAELYAANERLQQEVEKHRLAETALKESESTIRAIFDSSDDMTVLVDRNGTIIKLNANAARSLGGTEEELIGKDMYGLLPSKCAQRGQAMGKEVVQTGTPVHFQEERNGRHFDVTLYPVVGPEGIEHIAIFSRDITDQKLLVAQLFEAQKMEAVGRLAGGVAHDFNNLITAIMGFTARLQKRFRSEPAKGELEQIWKSAKMAASVTAQLLALGHKQSLEPTELNLNDVIADLDSMLRRVLGEKIRLVTKADVDLGTTTADRSSMAQVVINLVVNARDAMPAGGTLTIATANERIPEALSFGNASVPAGAYVTLTVEDTGSGIRPEILPHIFEPFFTTKDVGEGTGLGLSTAYGIVAQNRGRIGVVSELGHGTIFKLFLPCTVEETCIVSEPVSFCPEELRGHETVLVVEDEDVVRDLTCLMLTDCGYSVLEARNGAEALARASQHDGVIDLVLTDVVMPEIDGPELIERLAVTYPELRAVFMSGYSGSRLNDAIEIDVPLVKKPFQSEDLLRTIRAALEGPRSLRAAS